MNEEEMNKLSHSIIGAAIEVHCVLGVGLFESVYKRALVIELEQRGLDVLAEVAVNVDYKGVAISDIGFRIDLLVENAVIIELKSVEKVSAIHKKQLMTYLKLANKRLGLLINFNEEKLVDGITRVVNKL